MDVFQGDAVVPHIPADDTPQAGETTAEVMGFSYAPIVPQGLRGAELERAGAVRTPGAGYAKRSTHFS